MRIKDQYEMLNFGEEVVLVPVGDEAKKYNRIYSVKKGSTQLIEALQQDRSVEELADMMMQEYNVSFETVTQDIRKFIEKLAQYDLLAE